MDSLRNPESRVTQEDREKDCLKRYTEFESGHLFEAVAMANDGDGRHYGYRRESQRHASELLDTYRVQWEPTDLVEELTGVARIDIEIR